MATEFGNPVASAADEQARLVCDLIGSASPARPPITMVTAASVGAHDRAYYGTKRILDLVLSTALMILLSPVVLLIALLIKIDSRGPALYIQQRAGCRRRRNGRQFVWSLWTFRCYKFRSMVHNADPSIHQRYVEDFRRGRLGPETSKNVPYKLQRDPRVTAVGTFLRRTSLDELPQLINVVRGEMSLVGPRPVPLYEVAQYEATDFERFTALPGITGIWQVRGRGRVPFREMMRMDIAYARQRSLWRDLSLLAQTIPAVLCRRGAA